MTTSFANLALVAAAAFVAPLALGLFPRLRFPAVVLEIVFGILIGPDALGWVHVDEAVRVLSLIGLAFLLFLAGLEVEIEQLRGRLLRTSSLAFGVSFALALAVAASFDAVGAVNAPLLIAIVLSATSLGIVVPVLKDAGQLATRTGQLVLAGASIADVATIVLLSVFFSERAGGLGAQLVFLAAFVLLAAALALALVGASHSARLAMELARLQDTTAQIRVRGAFVLLALFLVVAAEFGVETILGAFIAGVILTLVDPDRAMTHPQFRTKLDAVGYGVFVPFFFVTSGVRFELEALLGSESALLRVPLFAAALLVVRGVPALLLYRGEIGLRASVAAGLLQATSLSFLVVAGGIGAELGLIDTVTASALVGAGLLSVVLFPAAALAVVGRNETPPETTENPNS